MARQKKLTAIKPKAKKAKDNNIESFNSDMDDFLRGAGVDVATLSEFDQVPYWVDSGSYALNWIISNDMFRGVPGTKIILISGEEAKGKSLIADVWLGNNIREGGSSYKIEVEDAGGMEFTAQIIGDKDIASQIRTITKERLKAINKAKGNVDKLNPSDLVITIENLTTLLNKMVDYQLSKGETRSKSLFITIDSVSQLVSEKETQDVAAGKDKKDMTPQQKMRQLVRILNQKLKDANVTVVMIAHNTANIGVMFGDKMTVSAKGSGAKYGNSLTINMMSSKEIIDAKSKVPIGIRMKLKTTKNRIKYKGRETFLYMYFAHGVDRYGGLSELLCKFDLATVSAKANLDGSFNPTAKVSYTKEDGAKLTWTPLTIKETIDANGGEDLIKEFNTRLNEKYDSILKSAGVSEESLLESDDPESDESDEASDD